MKLKQSKEMEKNKINTKDEKMEKVLKCKIKKDKNYLYFVDKEGDVSRAKLKRGRKKSS